MSELHESILEHLSLAISVISREGDIRYRNRAFSDSFGTKAEDWIRGAAGTTAGEPGWLMAFFDGSRNETEVEFDGRYYEVTTVPAATPESEIAFAFEDVTLNREMEQAKSDFTSMIVHDLRGPLSGIQGTLEFILSSDETPLDSLHEDLLREAMSESMRMMDLVNELLDFSKIESGNFTMEKSPTHVGSILKRSVHSLQQAAARAGVTILSAHSLDIPVVSGNSEKLTQVMINLLSNALKFTPKGGVISVGATVRPTAGNDYEIVVSVTDSGVGIRTDDQSHLFQKYKQSKSKSLRGGGGTGLGLYIVKQLVEAHGGQIFLASMEGYGTSMTFTLPVLSPR